MILAVNHIEKSYGIDTILENITFHIEEREKTAIVGVNGAGKTTLFRILTGEISSDGGDVFLKKETTMGYMAQNQQIESSRTIYEEMLSVFEKILTAEVRLREMENEMTHLSGKALSDMMEDYAALQHEFEQNDGYSYKSRLKGVLKGLGFGEDEFDRPLSQLSGGQKTRVYLGKLLLSKPDLLLLDEPTNHLDIASIEWLEDFLKTYDGSVLIISHDRYFLDKIVTKVVEIENRKSTVYNGNYTAYMNQKAINRDIQQKAYENQQRELKRQEEVIRTLKAFNREKSIKRAESREKMLEKVERIDRPDSLPSQMRLTLTPRIISGSDVLHAEELSKSYGGQRIFRHVNLDIKRGENVAIIGPNGVGKSTLFKMLLGEVPSDSGLMRFGTNVHVGYYDQEQQKLDSNKTIFDEISDTYPTLTAGEIRNMLAAFVFTEDDVFKQVSSLSGGEKGRVSLAKIMLSKANLLMLDEPTNHLDMFSKEVLEDALNRYEGTVVYISHDRYFINQVATGILEFGESDVQFYGMNYAQYLEEIKRQTSGRETGNAGGVVRKPADVPTLDDVFDKKKYYNPGKILSRLKRQLEKYEEQLAESESRMSELQLEMMDPELSANYEQLMELQTKIDEENQVQESLLERMMETELELEEMETSESAFVRRQERY